MLCDAGIGNLQQLESTHANYSGNNHFNDSNRSEYLVPVDDYEQDCGTKASHSQHIVNGAWNRLVRAQAWRALQELSQQGQEGLLVMRWII